MREQAEKMRAAKARRKAEREALQNAPQPAPEPEPVPTPPPTTRREAMLASLSLDDFLSFVARKDFPVEAFKTFVGEEVKNPRSKDAWDELLERFDPKRIGFMEYAEAMSFPQSMIDRWLTFIRISYGDTPPSPRRKEEWDGIYAACVNSRM
ncbi:MAG: hypothetical protein WC551_10035 [Patescibacteria group bacterium]